MSGFDKPQLRIKNSKKSVDTSNVHRSVFLQKGVQFFFIQFIAFYFIQFHLMYLLHLFLFLTRIKKVLHKGNKSKMENS